MDRGETYNHGLPAAAWEAAKEEARGLMRDRAVRRRPLIYSELVEGMTAIRLEPRDPRLAHFLGQISREEHNAGRGLLTALVVHKHDGLPGDGFFELAAELGRSTTDRVKCWLAEIDRLASEAGAAEQ
jgi:hypothetical protein